MTFSVIRARPPLPQSFSIWSCFMPCNQHPGMGNVYVETVLRDPNNSRLIFLKTMISSLISRNLNKKAWLFFLVVWILIFRHGLKTLFYEWEGTINSRASGLLWDSKKFLCYQFLVEIIANGNWDGIAVQKWEGFLIIAVIVFLQGEITLHQLKEGVLKMPKHFKCFLQCPTFHKFNWEFSFMRRVSRNAVSSGHLW